MKIEIRNISFVYPDGISALQEVSFSVPSGSALGIVGPNGAGKSTLLSLLNGSALAQSGQILIGGTTVTPENLPAVRRSIGMVFQDPDDQLFMPSVGEDVAFAPRNAGLSPAEVAQRSQAAMQQAGILHLSARPPYRLSGGEKRAAAIATALSLTPDVLLMDEPSSNLDPRGRRRLIDFLRGLSITRLIATHDLELVVELCSETVLFDAGRLVASGPTHELLKNSELMLAHGLETPHILRHLHPHH